MFIIIMLQLVDFNLMQKNHVYLVQIWHWVWIPTFCGEKESNVIAEIV